VETGIRQPESYNAGRHAFMDRDFMTKALFGQTESALPGKNRGSCQSLRPAV